MRCTNYCSSPVQDILLGLSGPFGWTFSKVTEPSEFAVARLPEMKRDSVGMPDAFVPTVAVPPIMSLLSKAPSAFTSMGWKLGVPPLSVSTAMSQPVPPDRQVVVDGIMLLKNTRLPSLAELVTTRSFAVGSGIFQPFCVE